MFSLKSHRDCWWHGTSCATDSLCEPFYYDIFKRNQKIQLLRDGVFTPLNQLCKSRDLHGFVTPEMREPLWDFCVKELPEAFWPKGRFDSEVAGAYRELGNSLRGEMMFSCQISCTISCEDCCFDFVKKHSVKVYWQYHILVTRGI